MSKPLSRRRFILTTTAGSLGLAASGFPLANTALRTATTPTGSPQIHLPSGAPQTTDPSQNSAPPHLSGDAAELYTLSNTLTSTWARTLLSLQVLDSTNPQEYGGILCPTRHIVHGRVGDTIYPFLHMAHRTGDHRYIDASELLFRWMENHVSQPDGSWLNEIKDSWKGTTVFSVIALCEALRYHGELMSPDFRSALQIRLQKAGKYIYDNVNIDYGNINYPLSASYALSLLGTVQDEPRFRERGRQLAHQSLSFFSHKDNFIFGEGTPYYEASKKGCFSVDLGYNVEETLPSLTLYGLLNQDEEILQQVTRSLQTHMEFMLPDGGWDNSWGTRNYKWTWWGSRTSDGCQPAYALLADRDPRFARAALKNTQLLERCTHEGLLYGGPHYLTHKIPPSVHHTFCHIKALTTILDHQQAQITASATSAPNPTIPAATPLKTTTPSLLPRESAYGYRFFPDIQTWLISVGDYRATVTAYDRQYKAMHNGHATGGALSLLWHDLTGPLLVASMNAYQLVEAGNMQADNDPLSMPLTPRIEMKTTGNTYMNISDLEAKVTMDLRKDRLIIKTRSRLVDKDQHAPEQGPIDCHTTYVFMRNKIILSFGAAPYNDNIRLILPVISPTGEPITKKGDKRVHIQKEKAILTISADQPLQQLPTTGGRLFNFVPGLEAIPLAISHQEASITITVKQK